MPLGVSFYDQARLQGRLWSPDPSEIAIWLDAYDPRVVTLVSGAVSQVTNKGGLGIGDATQATSGNRPTFSRSGLGPNRPAVVHSSASAQYLSLPNLGSVSWTAAELLYVFKRTADPSVAEVSSGPLFASGTAPSDGGEHEPYPSPVNIDLATFTANRKAAGTHTQSYATSARLINIRSSGSEWSYWIDGKVNFTTGTNSFAKPTTPRIGYSSYLANNYYLDGGWSEFICFPTVVSSFVRSRYMGYLAWKHGLQANLTVGLQFRDRPPLIGD